MSDSPTPRLIAAALAVVRVIGVIVPRRDRSAWRREWESEILNGHMTLEREHRSTWREHMPLTRRALGSFLDAAWLRRQFTRDSEVVQDLRHISRISGRSPAMMGLVVAVLAMGIGATTAVFSAVEAMFLRPLPYANADQIVMLWQRSQTAAAADEDVAPANFLDWRAQLATGFEAVAAAEPFSRDYTGAGEPEIFAGARVTEGFFDVLRVEPRLGRFLTADDYRLRRNVVVLSTGIWLRRFGGDPGVIGRQVRLDDEPFEIVGVLPVAFEPRVLAPTLDIWTPKAVIEDYETRSRGGGYWHVVAKLRPGTTLAQAQAELDAVSTKLAAAHPRTNKDMRAWVMPLRTHLAGGLDRTVLLLGVGAALILVLACTTVANLLFGLLAARLREFAVRTALGADRARLVRQVLTESAAIAGVAVIGGIGISWSMVTLIRAASPPTSPVVGVAAINLTVLAFAIVAGLVAAMVSAVLPILTVTRANVTPALRGTLASRTASAAPRQARSALVVVQISLALILLIASGLLVRSLVRLLAVDPGLSTRQLVAAQVFAYDRNDTAAKRIAFFAETVARIQTLPGVEAVGAASTVPFVKADINIEVPLTIVGRPPASEAEAPTVFLTAATPGYFRAAGIPLRRGRIFDEDATLTSRIVAVINDTVARRHYFGEEPIGRLIEVVDHGRRKQAEIIGVVGDLRYGGLNGQSRAEVFLPHRQSPQASMTYVVRTTVDPAAMITSIKQRVWSVDPLQTFYDVGAVEDMIEASLRPRVLALRLVLLLSAVGIVLALAGTYGAVSSVIRRRTSEFGVRVALGATGSDIRRLIILYGLRLTAAGIGIGLLATVPLTRLMETFLFGVSPTDPTTFLALSGVLAVAVLVAAYFPAQRASRLDPVKALRESEI
ncbi:MAG TPA: ABC transporter permease [Vicinamibacterales bacterium]|nr:ABC transporter permease [Vicinamibacterales bacterium]